MLYPLYVYLLIPVSLSRTTETLVMKVSLISDVFAKIELAFPNIPSQFSED